MQYTPENAQLVMSGAKTQTRRVKKPNEELVIIDGKKTVVQTLPNGKKRIKWQVGRINAVVPGRGKKGIGHQRLLDIRQECVQDISEADAVAEGCTTVHYSVSGAPSPHNPFPESHAARAEYRALWDRINRRKSTRWQDNPMVFVLSVELVKDGAS